MESSVAGNNYVLGAEIGGTHITTALVDLEKKELVRGSKIRANVNSQGSAHIILNAWIDALGYVISKSDKPVMLVGIAMPGPFDYENGISLIQNMHKYDALYGMDIRKIFGEKLNMDPLRIHFRNDAEAFLDGEVFCGAAVGYDKAIGITLGTGLGSATSRSGITRDVNLGSSPFLDGIAEDYISTRWFLKRYRELAGHSIRDVKLLAELAPNDIIVQQIFKEFTTHLSAFLKSFVNNENPEVVVIGGGITGAANLFMEDVVKSFYGDKNKVDFKISQLGEEASLIGAASIFRFEEHVK